MAPLLSHEESSETIPWWQNHCTGQRSRWSLKASFVSSGQLHGRITLEHHLAIPATAWSYWRPALSAQRC